jgi:uncharacterized protein YozE (UPF0346 family)
VLGLPEVQIHLKNGKVYLNNPTFGDNLADIKSIKEFIEEHGRYYLTLGNHRKVWIEKNDILEIK